MSLGLLGDMVATEAKKKERDDWLADQVGERLALLFAHYGVTDVNDWAKLALALAIDHVPGLRIREQRKKSGPRKFWSDERYCELLAAVERLKLEKGCGDSEACKILATSSKFAKAAWNGRTKQTKRSLETRLSEARNPKFNWLARVLVDKSDPLFQETMRDSLLRSYGLDPVRDYGIKPSQN